jgi:hypothetical protein
MTKTLTVGELTTKDRERAKQNHETYKMLYKQCTDHIKRQNDMGSTSTTYYVSEYVLGRPIFKRSHAMRYIAGKLEHGKFHVATDPGTGYLWIDWGKEKQKQIRTTVPKDLGIDQSKLVKLKKRKTKTRHNDTIKVQTWLDNTPMDRGLETPVCTQRSTRSNTKKNTKKKKKKPLQKIEEPISMRISRLNAALSMKT